MPGPWQRKSGGGVGGGGWARCSRCCSSDPGGVACVCSRTRAGCERLFSVLLLLAFSHKETIKPFVRCFAPASLRMRAGRQRLILVAAKGPLLCTLARSLAARMAEEANPAAAAAPPAHGSAAPAVANSAAADDAQAALASLRAIERSARVVATDAAILVGTAHHALQSVRGTAPHYAPSPLRPRPTPVPPRHSSRSTRRST